jgi:hypothetical protein
MVRSTACDPPGFSMATVFQSLWWCAVQTWSLAQGCAAHVARPDSRDLDSPVKNSRSRGGTAR